jgi:hypothetical protein
MDTPETPSVDEQILAEMKTMNATLAEIVKQSVATDWKLWIIMNALCDGLLSQGVLDDDPRKAKK